LQNMAASSSVHVTKILHWRRKQQVPLEYW
jgi:hypothetical protein